MKKVITLFIIFCFLFAGHAQVTKTANVSTSGTLFSDSLNMKNYLRNSSINNRFFTSPKGGCNLKYNNDIIYSLSNKTGDSWVLNFEDIPEVGFDPRNTKILYCINKEGIVSKSMNAGQNWIEIQNGLPSNLAGSTILVNPHKSSEVFLLSQMGIYKTSDAGFTWVLFCPNSANQFKIHTTKQNTFYLNSYDSLLLTNDAGITWKNISNTLPKTMEKGIGRTANFIPQKIYSLIVIELPTNTILLTYTLNGIFKTVDDGANWTKVNNGLNDSTTIYSTYLSENEIYYGGVDKKTGTVFCKSDMNGENWNMVDLKANDLYCITGIFKDTAYPGIFITDVNNKIAYVDTSLNVIGLNYGVTPHSIIHAFDITKTDNGYIQYAIVQNNNQIDIDKQGIWRSLNNGLSWEKLFIYDRADFYNKSNIYVSPFNSNEIWFFYKNNKYKTIDGGKTWEEIYLDYEFGLQFDYQNKNILYYSNFVEGSGGLVRYDKITNGVTKLYDNARDVIVAKDNSMKLVSSKPELSLDGGWTWKSITANMTELLNLNNTFNSDFEINRLEPVNIEGKHITMNANIYTYKEKNINILISSDDDGQTWNWKSDKHLYMTFLYINYKEASKLIMVNKTKDVSTGNFNGLVVSQSMDTGKTWKVIFNLTPKNIKNYIEHYVENSESNYNLMDEFIFSIYTDIIDGKTVTYLGLSTGGMIYTNNDGLTWNKMGGIYESK